MFLALLLACALIAFVVGSLPFSVWIGRWMLGVDIREYGDANPGATNVLRAGGRGAAGLALSLDMLKGAIPVGIVHFGLGFTGWALALVSLAPIAGHAFSPFLNWRGGKAVATTCGIWCGLTVWEGPTVGGLLLGLFVYLVGGNGWAVVFAMCGMLGYFIFAPPTWSGLIMRPPLLPTLLAVWTGNLLLLMWKHRADLSHPPTLRSS